ncbi:VOC family protein [Paenibacillaceae bacterium WGS1546]|uniref:VOC family protein n=1 Tax=Cohnella sp. WGS1546 TaxID=3366810 RepID=UPI00372D3DFC
MSCEFIGLDHVQLAEWEGCELAARKFYGEDLGWPEIPKPESLRKRGGVWFLCGAHQVHIGVQPDFAPAKKAHPAFEVRNLERLRKRLNALGIETTRDSSREEENVQRIFVHDPFGNRLEFLEREGRER